RTGCVGRAHRNPRPCGLLSKSRLAPPASTVAAVHNPQGIGLQLFFTGYQGRYGDGSWLRATRAGPAILSLYEHALHLAAVGFDAGHAGRHVDLEAVTFEHVLALGEHDPAHHGDEVGPR